MLQRVWSMQFYHRSWVVGLTFYIVTFLRPFISPFPTRQKAEGLEKSKEIISFAILEASVRSHFRSLTLQLSQLVSCTWTIVFGIIHITNMYTLSHPTQVKILGFVSLKNNRDIYNWIAKENGLVGSLSLLNRYVGGRLFSSKLCRSFVLFAK